MKMQASQSSRKHDSAARRSRSKKTIGWVGALAVLLGAGVGPGVVGTDTANACETAASPLAAVDCDGVQHGELNMSIIDVVDGRPVIAGEHRISNFLLWQLVHPTNWTYRGR